MIRVLQVYPQMNNAGTEMVIMNIVKNVSCEEIHFDFLVQKKGIRDKEIKSLGGNIYYIKNNKKIEYYRKLIDFFTDNCDIDIVHVHTHKEMGIVLKAAKKANIKVRIAHSHNARQDLPKLGSVYKYFSSWNIEKYATDFFACSNEAAKWLFPRKYKKFVFVPNGINTKKFMFSKEKRINIRNAIGISESDFVVGHVGRLAKQKNHDYLLEIARKCNDKNIKFVCVGEGPLLKKINEKIKKNHLENKVIMVGASKDVEKFYCAFDMFILPSLHEGLGIVAIEAQASGLYCLLSTNVPKTADTNNNQCQFLSINKEDIDIWIKKINDIRDIYKISHRKKINKLISNSIYDIIYSSEITKKYYIEKLNKM